MLKKVLKKNISQLPPLIPISSASHFDEPTPEDLSPIEWTDFFQQQQQILLPSGSFCVYQSFPPPSASSAAPVPLCPHLPARPACSTVYCLLHGAGHTALSWALVAQHLALHSRVVAVDLRGHGATCTSPPAASSDLSLDTMAQDCIDLLDHLLLESSSSSSSSSSSPSSSQTPSVVLVGHSMGAAVATRMAASQREMFSGLVVVDLVEGTAIESLERCRSLVASRPLGFSSVASAVRWAVKSGMPKHTEAARVSIPSQLRPVQEGDRAELLRACPDSEDVPQWVWRTDVLASEKYWRSWYEGLSESFLSVKARKMLILAGTDRLDKTLLIGQMQGKFQLVVLPESGHCVQEDQPELTADHLFNFKIRYGL